jgi:hypothetical protein
MWLGLIGWQDNKIDFAALQELFSTCEKAGYKQLVQTVKMPSRVGSFRYICAS